MHTPIASITSVLNAHINGNKVIRSVEEVRAKITSVPNVTIHPKHLAKIQHAQD